MKIIFLLLIFFSNSITLAYKCMNPKDLKKIVIYINGFDNDYSNTKTIYASQEIIKKLKSASSKIDQSEYIPNQTKGFLSDLAMAYYQKTEEANRHSKTLRFFNKMKSNTTALATNLMSLSSRNDNSKFITDELKEYVLTGNKIIVVSHSQGNLYANEACVQIKKDKDVPSYLKDPVPFENIQVATPASVIECSQKEDNYVSLDKDSMISQVTIGASASKFYLGSNTVLKPLTHNVSVKNFKSLDPEDAGRYHNMLSVYLNFPASKNKIFSLIQETEKSFAFHGLDEIILFASTGYGYDYFDSKNRKTYKEVFCRDLKEGVMSFPIIPQGNTYDLSVNLLNEGKKRLYERVPSSVNLEIENSYSKSEGYKVLIKNPNEYRYHNIFDSIKEWLYALFIPIGIIFVFMNFPTPKKEEDKPE